VVSCNHLNKFDDRLARLGGELNVVCVKLVVEFVVGAIIIRFFRCAQVLCIRFNGFFHLFWFLGDLIPR
jgi:hypothetical protein